MLVGARLSGVWHHARAHRFFSGARWSVDELGLRLACLIVDRFTQPGEAVLIAVDDTLLKALGRRVHGTFWHHDTGRQQPLRLGRVRQQLPRRRYLRETAVHGSDSVPAGPVPALAATPQTVRQGPCC